MTNCLEKELFIRFTARAFRKLLSVYVFNYFPFGFQDRIWDLIVSVPDHCLSFYFVNSFLKQNVKNKKKNLYFFFFLYSRSMCIRIP